ncbi:DUF2970 domain-containing protein [Permianibacter sp. IMCC34836]|uniref:DUF2970 domain-containing protein n=1 Tax=Permianibacter fluminis TaxID=2738515 RepID=UPI001556175D|nr:DUF2970 domain-containing protein [Permianibacter fluminis]
MSDQPANTPTPEQEPQRPGVLNMLQSVAAAAFGVQSEKKRQQDFQHGKPGDYIALGVIFVIVFIVTLIVVVNMVLSSAGK